ncbi:MAG: sialate O-acetylesterase [Bacilli bacterium]
MDAKKRIILALMFLGILTSCSGSKPLETGSGTPSTNWSEIADSELPEYEDVDVFVMAGQSNMEGSTQIQSRYGDDQYFWDYCVSNDLNYQTYVDGFSSIKISYHNKYNETVFNYSNPEEPMKGKFVPVKLGQGTTARHFGPEVGLAEALVNHYGTEKPVYLIKYASGATGFTSSTTHNWKSESSGSCGDLYLGIIQYVENCLELIKQEEKNPVIKGFMWMQGEQDGGSKTAADAYKGYLLNFIDDLFTSFGPHASDKNKENIHFIDGLIYDKVDKTWAHGHLVNQAKIEISQLRENNHIVDTTETGLNLDIHSPGGDIYHFNVGSMLKLGAGFADVLIENSIIRG